MYYIFFSHNTEKVIYFLLLERKRRRPAFEDDTDSLLRSRAVDSGDPPRKRIDTCKVVIFQTYYIIQYRINLWICHNILILSHS